MQTQTTQRPTAVEWFRADPKGFGRAMKKALWTEEAIALTPGQGLYGWNDGGCLLLADAIAHLLPCEGRIMAVTKPGDTLGQHFVYQAGLWFLDGDGACHERALIRRWTRELDRPGVRTVPRTVPIWESVISDGTDRDDTSSRSIAAYLADKLGCRPAVAVDVR